MKKITKNLIAAAMAGCLSVSSTVGAFASVSRTPSLVEDGDQRRVVASFVHGSEYVSSGGTEVRATISLCPACRTEAA